MTVFTLIAFIFEIWGVVFLIWGAFHEKKLIKFERKIARIWRFGVGKVKQAVQQRKAQKMKRNETTGGLY